MTDKKTKSLTLPTSGADLVARMREIHDLDTPRPAERSEEAQQPSNAETQKRDNVETQECSSATTPLATNAETLPRESAETPQHRNVEAQQPGNAETLQHDNADALERGSVPTKPPTNASTPQPGNEAAQQRSNTETRKPANAETQKRTSDATSKRTSAEAPRRHEEAEDNPVHVAICQALRRPYSADLDKAPSTATTIRIPTEIWERLDMASTLQNKTKQDLIAEALMRYLTKIGRGEA